MEKMQISRSLKKHERTVRAIYFSSYIPRKCGIATFTKDLTNSINTLNPTALAEILAVNENGGYDYPWEVKYRISQGDHDAYLAAADYVNSSSAEVLSLQHEFGLYGGPDGEYILDFLKQINKKIVVTLHTVLEEPNPNQKRIIQEIGKTVDAVVVMIEAGYERLVRIYGLDPEKIVVIPHGVPDLPFGGTEHFKKQKHLQNKVVMSAINLIADNKGLEYALDAIPEIIKTIPNFLFLIIGETHPGVKKREGEKYRNFLKKRVEDLGIEDHVRFVNKYLPLEDLVTYLRATDIYITPYLNPQQIASGTLSYAVGAGKVCISTPYLYAEEVLDGSRGILVPFKDSSAISKSVLDVFGDHDLRISLEKEAYTYGRLMTWSAVALRYLDLFSLILERETKNV